MDVLGRIQTIYPIKGGFPIQEAIRKAIAHDTLIVTAGIYREGNIRIEMPLTLLGRDFPILDGDKKFEVITILSDSVEVSGFKIQHSSYATLDDPGGIKVIGSKDIRITNNLLYDNFFGVYLQEVENCLIQNNRIIAIGKEEQEIGNGIHCWKSDRILIIGNNISGNRDGIYFEFVTHSVIWRNISHGNSRYGLHFMFSNDDSYFSNIFHHNGAGVAVMFTKGVTMMNNYFLDNWGESSYGLLLKEISDAYIGGNTFKRNTAALFMEGTSRIQFERNLIQENGWGLKIQASCMDNTISDNTFTGNTFDISTNGNLVLNVFSGNYWDRYEGYDLDKDGIGDVPYHPLSLFCVIVEQNPTVMMMYRSFIIGLLDRSEKMIPSITPSNFVDIRPSMQPIRC
jgi:nitrous oxidase accessory protein